MSKIVLELGSSPVNENCAQLGSDGYEELARRECSAYIKQLRRVYLAERGGNLPESVTLRTKSNEHDFGRYYEVAVSCESSDEVAIDAAFWLENNQPLEWDAIARSELGE